MTELRKTLKGSIPEVRSRLEAALKEEGFGILTEIDVAATLKARLGLEKPPYLILGACNPHLAAQALEALPEIGLLLPCNVVLREAEEGVEVLVQDPGEMFRVLPEAAQKTLAPVAEEARTRLSRALARL
ncbi:hypothetical protein TTMY_1337 [Thermus thermophilus]|uniref:DUF302 domain-containing protein n=1 Tax=Thermus thermophilus TaxID=274 RepID=UPI00090BBDE7|nr:DUF302 domain-containing protein [Thermus thermophilus]BAW01727.1 hypothetical protein TTMY_1337 [Thermus thermophilus]BDB12328.1 hypothetical protein TthTMY_20670 [Thermus thermophilus]